MPVTMVELLRGRGERILELLSSLLDRSTLESINRSDSSVVVVGAVHAWNELDAEGRRLQSRLLNELDRYVPLVEAFVRVVPADQRRDVDQANETLREIADRSHRTWYATPEAARRAAEKALATHLETLESLDDPSAGQPIYVPDANATIRNPSLDEWEFPEVSRFVLVLTSSLLSELDDLKMTYRVETVRETAEAVINRIKEYGRRGDIHEGVTLRGDRSSVRMLATEPDFNTTLRWLDPNVPDDRYIATIVELIRRHPRSPVAIVTADVNLQNKARHAGIPFVEPPAAGRREAPVKAAKPRDVADIRILDVKPTGGSSPHVTFTADVQNYGNRPVRATLRATVSGQPVACQPDPVDLLVNRPPTLVHIDVPRPQLGELVPQFNNETTLYGEELRLEVVVGEQRWVEVWREKVYDAETERERHDVQQRVWRMGRGEETPDDVRDEAVSAQLRRLDES
jgi:hypothetical protein